MAQRSSWDYDSVIIAGDGIGALTMAGKLAQSDKFAGRVVVAAPKPRPASRRLILGCSLRGSSIQPICEGLGISRTDFLDTLFDGPLGYPACHRATLAFWKAGKAGDAFRPYGNGTWMGGGRGNDTAYAYSTRNQHITETMRQFVEKLPIQFVEKKIESAEEMRSLAEEGKTLLVNATGNTELFGLSGRPIKRMCFAVQGTFRPKPSGLQLPLRPGEIHAPFVRRGGIVDVGFITPFSDPLNPNATWYAILSRPVLANSGFDKEAELEQLTDELLRIADGGGLEPVDIEETLAKALVPGGWYTNPIRSQRDTLELKTLYTAGVPTYFADGMVNAARCGLVAAERVIEGRDPHPAIVRATRYTRLSNYVHWLLMGSFSGITEVLLKSTPVLGSKVYSPQHALWREETLV